MYVFVRLGILGNFNGVLGEILTQYIYARRARSIYCDINSVYHKGSELLYTCRPVLELT